MLSIYKTTGTFHGQKVNLKLLTESKTIFILVKFSCMISSILKPVVHSWLHRDVHKFGTPLTTKGREETAPRHKKERAQIPSIPLFREGHSVPASPKAYTFHVRCHIAHLKVMLPKVITIMMH